MNTTAQPFLDLAHRRYSVRKYAARPVDRDSIGRCLEAARWAPSACNSQPWTFVVVDEPGLKDAVAAASSGGILPLNHFTRQAPVLVAVIAEKPTLTAGAGAVLKDKPFALMDCAIAAEHFCLQAAAEGLGTCMLGWFDEARVRSLLSIPSSSRPVLLMTLGHPAEPEAAPNRRRKPLNAMSGWNGYPGEAPAAAQPKRRSPGMLLFWLGLTGLAALAGGLATARAGAFYAELTRPAWAPPGWVFGPVWTVLYLLMAVAIWRVGRYPGKAQVRSASMLYIVQLAVNALWSWLFFAWRLGAVAFLWILLLCVLVTLLQRMVSRMDRLAGRLLWPYLAWLCFAAALAGAVWRLNPGVL